MFVAYRGYTLIVMLRHISYIIRMCVCVDHRGYKHIVLEIIALSLRDVDMCVCVMGVCIVL